jgi:hypothetical protein
MYSELIHFLKVRLLNYFLLHPILIDDLDLFFIFLFFDMSTQEGKGGFELVASASGGVVPNRLSYPLGT